MPSVYPSVTPTAANQEAVDKNLGIIKQYKPRVASMLKAYCK